LFAYPRYTLQRTKTPTDNSGQRRQPETLQTRLVFCLLWVLLFVLYYPAAKAGFVTDFTGWLDQVKNHSFSEYINRTNFHATSLYQFTQLVTYVFYKLFGIHAWLWHLLFISLHALNCCLLFVFCSRLLFDAGVENGKTISFAGVLLFCVSPYMSEVIVWEPSFHFLQGLLLIVLILIWTQQYIANGEKKYAWWAVAVYLLSTFSLEIFYITPWLVLVLGLFYRFLPAFDEKNIKKVLIYLFTPMLALFAFRLVLFRVIYGNWVSRIGTRSVTAIDIHSFGKPAKYIFHILFLGRFFSDDIRQRVYEFCDSTTGIGIFYGIMALVTIYILTRFKKMGGRGKVASLLLKYTLVTLALLIPLWFGNSQLVIFDRYDYFAGAFLYLLLAVMVSFIPVQIVRIGVIGLFVLINLRFAIKVNRYWGKSYHVDKALLVNLPDPGNKIIILLNLPENMNGVPMIGSEKESEYKLMHNLLLADRQIGNTVYDALSYNMSTPGDGAHVTVANDSMIHVTLNQWGTWWWYEGKGGHSYENEDYKLNLIDAGHWYELTLKKPAQQYLLLYQTGNQWKTVDMNRRNEDQY
jgi:hypothetical protein